MPSDGDPDAEEDPESGDGSTDPWIAVPEDDSADSRPAEGPDGRDDEAGSANPDPADRSADAGPDGNSTDPGEDPTDPDRDPVEPGDDAGSAPGGGPEPERLHPLTVAYRTLAGSINLGTLIFLATVIGSGSVDPSSLGFLGLLVAYLAVVATYQAAYYRRFSYVLADGSLDITSGVFSRRQREIPLGRVQNVDVSQNPIQRALGIAAVRIETAGGGDTEASLKYVGEERATRLRRILRDREGEPVGIDRREADTDAGTGTGTGTGTATGTAAGGPEEEVVFELPTRNLVLLSLFTIDPGAGAISSAVAAVTSGGDPQNVFMLRGIIDRLPGGTAQAVALVVVVVALAAWLLSVALTFARYYGFRLVRVGDELEYERGLLQRYSGTIPLEKVQTVSLGENLLKRRFGYATLSVETAGYAPGSDGGGAQSAVPLAEREVALSIAEGIEGFENPGIERPPKRARRRYVVRFGAAVAVLAGAGYGVATWASAIPDPGTRSLVAVAVALALVPVAAHLRWRNRGHGLSGDHFVARTGFWRRTTRIVPYFRIQTVVDSRTVFQRRRDLASVTADTASSRTFGGSDATAIDVDDGVADDLGETLRERLRESLRVRKRSRRAAPDPGLDTDRAGESGEWRGGSTAPDPGPDGEEGDEG